MCATAPPSPPPPPPSPHYALGNEANHEAADDARGHADDHGERGRGEGLLRHAVKGELGREQQVRQGRAGGHHEERGDDELALEGRLDEGLALDRVDGEEGRDEADEDTGSRDAEREHERGPAALGDELGGRGRNDEGSAGGLGERAEEVGRHAGDVAHVVAHVVGDGGGVARVVLGDVELSLAHQIGADVGGLGVDAAAHAAEHGDGGAAKAVARDAVHHDFVPAVGRWWVVL